VFHEKDNMGLSEVYTNVKNTDSLSESYINVKHTDSTPILGQKMPPT